MNITNSNGIFMGHWRDIADLLRDFHGYNMVYYWDIEGFSWNIEVVSGWLNIQAAKPGLGAEPDVLNPTDHRSSTMFFWNNIYSLENCLRGKPGCRNHNSANLSLPKKTAKRD